MRAEICQFLNGVYYLEDVTENDGTTDRPYNRRGRS